MTLLMENVALQMIVSLPYSLHTVDLSYFDGVAYNNGIAIVADQ